MFLFVSIAPAQIAKFKGPTWGPPGSCRPQMGPMLAPWTLLSACWLLSVTCRHSKDWVQVRLYRGLALEISNASGHQQKNQRNNPKFIYNFPGSKLEPVVVISIMRVVHKIWVHGESIIKRIYSANFTAKTVYNEWYILIQKINFEHIYNTSGSLWKYIEQALNVNIV